MVYFAHKNDDSCPYDVMKRYVKDIQAPVKLNLYRTRGVTGQDDGFGHPYASGGNNDASFFNQLKQALRPDTIGGWV